MSGATWEARTRNRPGRGLVGLGWLLLLVRACSYSMLCRWRWRQRRETAPPAVMLPGHPRMWAGNTLSLPRSFTLEACVVLVYWWLLRSDFSLFGFVFEEVSCGENSVFPWKHHLQPRWAFTESLGRLGTLELHFCPLHTGDLWQELILFLLLLECYFIF